jgi:hypothetical protein
MITKIVRLIERYHVEILITIVAISFVVGYSLGLIMGLSLFR